MKINLIIYAFLTFLLINRSYAETSTNTLKQIQGSKPVLSFDNGTALETDLSNLLSFTMPDKQNGLLTIRPDNTKKIIAEPDYTLDQFTTHVIANGEANPLPIEYYHDVDGDLPSEISGTLTVTWSYEAPDPNDGNKTITKKLTQADLSERFDACKAPYTLTIEAANIQLHSQHGFPRENDYGSGNQSYQVYVNDYKFCWARPNSMKMLITQQWRGWNGSAFIWNQGSSSATASGGKGGGYDQNFNPLYGFTTSVTTKFPRTGFAHAQFQLLMSNGQDQYTYQALEGGNNSSNVDIDATGNVTLKSKPTGTVTIRATPKIAGIDALDYSFNLRTWAIVKPGRVLWEEAVTACGGVDNLFKREELSNSPLIRAPLNWQFVDNHNTRAIDGGVFSEWGWSQDHDVETTYPNSGWNYGNYWTSEIHIEGHKHFHVTSNSGTIGSGYNDMNYYIVCRG